MSKKITHTPGPWLSATDSRGHPSHVAAEIGAVCNFGTAVRRMRAIDETQANSRLIAAAPDLLTALQMLHDETADYIRLNNLGGMNNQSMQLARAALARAVGAG